MEDVNLIRRPLVLRGPKSGIFGYNEDEYEGLG